MNESKEEKAFQLRATMVVLAKHVSSFRNRAQELKEEYESINHNELMRKKGSYDAMNFYKNKADDLIFVLKDFILISNDIIRQLEVLQEILNIKIKRMEKEENVFEEI